MSARPIAFLSLLSAAAAVPHAAAAGETRCWLDNGVVVAPASVAGVVGDYVIDTEAAASQMAETRAQSEGFDTPQVSGQVQLAGERLGDHALAVADLDMRTGALPTPVAGVLGADVLRGYVVDVRFAPCRLALWPAGKAPKLAGRAVPIDWRGAAPVIAARAVGGEHLLEGAFTVATGSDTAVRISDDAARAPGAAKPRELYPYGVARPRLRALELDARLFEQLPGGLLKAAETPALGEIGTPVLAHWRLRFDFPAGRLIFAPLGGGHEKGPPAAASGP